VRDRRNFVSTQLHALAVFFNCHFTSQQGQMNMDPSMAMGMRPGMPPGMSKNSQKSASNRSSKGNKGARSLSSAHSLVEWFVSFYTLFVLKREGKIATGDAAVVHSSFSPRKRAADG